jgi:cysteine desulfurase
MPATRAYFDCAATAPLRPEAAAAIQAVLAHSAGNASSLHQEGQAARAVIDDARRSVATLVGAHPGHVVFTSGGTEANNLALRGILAACPGQRLVISGQEHDCVWHTAHALAAQGVPLSVIPVSSQGCIDLIALEETLHQGEVGLVSIMHANNEHGVVQPIAAIAKLAKKYHAWCHTDAVQTVGHIPLNMASLGVDALTLSAHKLGGPQGVGALVISPQITGMVAHTTGGGHERNRRAGTENVVGIAGFGAAAATAHAHFKTEFAHTQAIRTLVLNELATLGNVAEIVAPAAPKVPHIVQIVLAAKDAPDAVIGLDMQEVAASQGSACSSGRTEASRVLLALGYSQIQAGRGLRLSWGPATTPAHVAQLGHALRQVLGVAPPA